MRVCERVVIVVYVDDLVENFGIAYFIINTDNSFNLNLAWPAVKIRAS